MPARRFLILGGTGDARRIAARLHGDGHHVVSSLAGVTAKPRLPVGEVRTGGFGGAEGLAEYIHAQLIDGLIDATHPYASVISRNAMQASRVTGVPCIRFERPGWEAAAGDAWSNVASVEAAAIALPRECCALVTIGRKEVAVFMQRKDVRVIARMIEAPEIEVPQNWRLILERPPFSVEQETQLMRSEGVDVLITKNAGGEGGRSKLDAARQLGVPVIMIERPKCPHETVVTTVYEVVAWIEQAVQDSQ